MNLIIQLFCVRFISLFVLCSVKLLLQLTAQPGARKHSIFVDTPENVGIIKVQQTEVSFGHQFKRES